MSTQREQVHADAGSEALATAGGVEEAARRQTLFREVNENIANLTGLQTETGYTLVVCECSLLDCADSLEITTDEYESVRAQGTRFVVVPGHQLDGVERVVDGNSRFLVVEKVGHAAEIANGHDPRRS